jgi:hypothetical protein
MVRAMLVLEPFSKCRMAAEVFSISGSPVFLSSTLPEGLGATAMLDFSVSRAGIERLEEDCVMELGVVT